MGQNHRPGKRCKACEQRRRLMVAAVKKGVSAASKQASQMKMKVFKRWQ